MSITSVSSTAAIFPADPSAAPQPASGQEHVKGAHHHGGRHHASASDENKSQPAETPATTATDTGTTNALDVTA